MHTPANCPHLPNHPMWEQPGVDWWTYPGDWMHTFCLGIGLYLHGGVMRDLVMVGGPFVGNVKARYDALWAMISAAYDALSTKARLPGCSPGALGERSMPGCLKAKASTSKHLTNAMVHVLERLPLASIIEQTRLQAYRSLASAYDLIDEGGAVLTTAESSALKGHVNDFQVCYNAVVNDSLAKGLNHFNWTIKMHCWPSYGIALRIPEP